MVTIEVDRIGIIIHIQTKTANVQLTRSHMPRSHAAAVMKTRNQAQSAKIVAKITSILEEKCNALLIKPPAEGYNQLALLRESRYISVFNTLMVLMCFRHLNCGISSAVQIFQNVISEILEGIDGAINIMYDFTHTIMN